MDTSIDSTKMMICLQYHFWYLTQPPKLSSPVSQAFSMLSEEHANMVMI